MPRYGLPWPSAKDGLECNGTGKLSGKRFPLRSKSNGLPALLWGFQNSEYYLVRPCGDLDEDAVDSRISCTQLWVLRKLEPQEFFLHALAYMADHPQMPDGCDVKRERAQAWNGYAVVRGKHPRAKGKLGDILAFAREAVNGPKIEHLSLCVIDGKERLPDTWYDDNFEECEAV